MLHKLYHFHFMEGVNNSATDPRARGRGSQGLDISDQTFNGVKGKGALNELPQSQMVVALVEKERRRPN